MLSSDFHCKETDLRTGAALLHLRVEVSQDMLDSKNSDPDFMNTIITGDESWVYEFDPESKSQSLQWNPTRALNTTSLNAACHQLTLLTGEKKFTHTCKGSRSFH